MVKMANFATYIYILPHVIWTNRKIYRETPSRHTYPPDQHIPHQHKETGRGGGMCCGDRDEVSGREGCTLSPFPTYYNVVRGRQGDSAQESTRSSKSLRDAQR